MKFLVSLLSMTLAFSVIAEEETSKFDELVGKVKDIDVNKLGEGFMKAATGKSAPQRGFEQALKMIYLQEKAENASAQAQAEQIIDTYLEKLAKHSTRQDGALFDYCKVGQQDMGCLSIDIGNAPYLIGSNAWKGNITQPSDVDQYKEEKDPEMATLLQKLAEGSSMGHAIQLTAAGLFGDDSLLYYAKDVFIEKEDSYCYYITAIPVTEDSLTKYSLMEDVGVTYEELRDNIYQIACHSKELVKDKTY